MEYILGENDNEVKIDTADAYRETVISMTQQAQHSIDIFTPDLESVIYNNIDIERAVLRLAKRHPDARIRILVQDSKKSVQDGHCLIRLAQRLTSSVFIHKPSREHKSETGAFVVVDQMGFIYRALAADRNYQAIFNFRSPRLAASQLEFFNEAWEHSTPDTQTRRIFL